MSRSVRAVVTLTLYDTAEVEWSVDAIAGDVTRSEPLVAAAHFGGWCATAPGASIPTHAQRVEMAAREAAARALPPGWAATHDGVSQDTTPEGAAYTRPFVRGDGAMVVASCAPDGGSTPETVSALAAYDAEHPAPVDA